MSGLTPGPYRWYVASSVVSEAKQHVGRHGGASMPPSSCLKLSSDDEHGRVWANPRTLKQEFFNSGFVKYSRVLMCFQASTGKFGVAYKEKSCKKSYIQAFSIFKYKTFRYYNFIIQYTNVKRLSSSKLTS